MSWRTVLISERAKCDYKNGFIVVRKESGEKQVHISEIGVLIFESTAVSLTAYLLNELVNSKVKVIFCTFNHNPVAELLPYYGSHNQVATIREQLSWKSEVKGEVWKRIVQLKIGKQAENLKFRGFETEYEMLMRFAREVQLHDESNREGHAAKVYFNRVFHSGFVRHSGGLINSLLDYAYAVLLSMFNREIVAAGYLTQLGIFHDNQFNCYNLACDLMEPFRPLVDKYILEKQFEKFDSAEKHILVQFTEKKVKYDGAEYFLPNAIQNYCRDVFSALRDGKPDEIHIWSEVTS